MPPIFTMYFLPSDLIPTAAHLSYFAFSCSSLQLKNTDSNLPCTAFVPSMASIYQGLPFISSLRVLFQPFVFF